METPLVETELEIIERHVRIAEKSYSDGKTPDEDNVKRISQELYNDLFGWRDSQPERPLQRPVCYSLTDIFKELKFGRPADDQKFLDKCIKKLG